MDSLERHKILFEWNKTARAYPQGKCLHLLFEEQVERTPDAVALVFEGESLTYRELNDRAERLASLLRWLGVGPEVLVALCVERSLEMVLSLLGILKAGGAYVPIDPSYPVQRVEFMLEDSDAPVLVAQRHLVAGLPPHRARLVVVDEDLETPSLRDADTAPCGVAASNLAYMIYTSGSTGQPKGALNTHRGICNRILWMQEEYPLTSADVVLQKTPFSFDVSGWEFFWPLLTGARLVVAKPGGHMDVDYLNEIIRAHGVTTLHFVPSMLRVFLQAPGVSTLKPIRHVFCSGEALTYRLQEEFFSRFDVPLYNLYGPTEAAIEVTHWTCHRGGGLKIVPIGRPVANTQCYILNPEGEPVGVGEQGELCIGGVQVGRGYHKRPELTAERFVPDPFSGVPLARLYRTGDLARYLPDGNIEFMGRVDHQVKVRGFRIELGEIEAELGGHPDISSCAVVALGSGGEDKSLAAFIVLRGRSGLTVEALREWLAGRLPDYMIPSHFRRIDALPLLPSGKVDLKSLENIEGEPMPTENEHEQARNPTELRLLEIWREVLGQNRIGIRDHFFHIGGHSLLAVMICARIRGDLDLEVPLRWMFDYPTIAGLTERLETLPQVAKDHSQSFKEEVAKTGLASFSSRGVWLNQQTLSDPATYNETIAFEFCGEVDQSQTRRALEAIVERHEILRSAFIWEKGDLVCRSTGMADMLFPWREIHLENLPEKQNRHSLDAFLLDEVRKPFDLDQAPLWRVVWIEAGGNQRILLMTLHHSIVDEWSLRHLASEWEKFYDANGDLESAGVPALPMQYRDFAAEQRHRLSGDRLASSRAYWKDKLYDLPAPLELPHQHRRPAVMSNRGGVHEFQISGETLTRIRKLARGQDASLFTVMLAAFMCWLHRFSGRDDIVVGTPHTQRSHPDHEQLVGFFLNTLSIRLCLTGEPDFQSVIAKVRESLFEAIAHVDLPFDQVVEMVVKERSSAFHPIFQTMFVLVEEGVPSMRLGSTRGTRLNVDTQTSKNDLLLSIDAFGDEWNCRFEYATDLFTGDAVRDLAERFKDFVSRIFSQPGIPICVVEVMRAEERQRILVEWNDTRTEYPRNQCIDHLFEEQARRSPDAVALEQDVEKMTYRELGLWSDEIARHLCLRGVQPGDLVGLAMARSFGRVAAMLGILKAGAVYWAVEENLPAPRLRFLVENASPKIIVSAGKIDFPSGLPVSVVLLSDLSDPVAGESFQKPFPRKADDPAYISYTSGSTGSPKGVVVPHRGVVRLVKNPDYVSLGPNETLLHLSPLSFDASTFELWGALLNGGRVVLMPPERLSISEIGRCIREHGVTTLWLTAGLFHLMVEESIDDLKPLRQLLAGGDVLSPSHVRKARIALPGCRIINGYGPTENTTFTCCHTVSDDVEKTDTVPIGRPISNTQVYILDGKLRPVPVGVPGELVAGGDGLACGYHNDPRLTAERFIFDPFGQGRVYRTGDLARWRADGSIEFLGRMDQQLKIRGFRVEPGEIEKEIRAIPGVADAAVVTHLLKGGEKILVGYLSGEESMPHGPDAIRNRLRNRLPDYMIPSRIVILDSMPLKPNGKLDRSALPYEELEDSAPEDESRKSIGLLESRLIRVWERLFQKTGIHRDDNFFELGGHSLMAARFGLELEELCGRWISIAALYQAPTIARLVAYLNANDWAPPWSSLVEFQSHGSKPPLFLVHGVGGMVFWGYRLIPYLEPDQSVYGVQAVGLDGERPRHTSLREMAEHYVREIRSLQPIGPYHLCGFSLGGLIAFEVAQELRRQNQQVAVLTLLDSRPTARMPWFFFLLEMAFYLPRRALFHLLKFWQMPLAGKADYLRKRLQALGNHVNKNKGDGHLVRNPDIEVEVWKEMKTDYYVNASQSYRVSRYDGVLDYVECDESKLGTRMFWWFITRGRARFHRIPGNHHEMVEPDFMHKVAMVISRALQRSRAEESGRITK